MHHIVIASLCCIDSILSSSILSDDSSKHSPSLDKTVDRRACNDETDVSICGIIRRGIALSFEANDWFSRCLSADPRGDQKSSRSQRQNNLTCILVRSAHYKPINNHTDIDASQGPTTAAAIDIISSIEDSTSSTNSSSTTTTTTISSHNPSASFVNSAQFLLLSLESVRSLNQVGDAHMTRRALISNTTTHHSFLSTHPYTHTHTHHPQIIISQDSRLEGNIKIENFRPNIVVSGGSGQPHQEDRWRTVSFEITVTQHALRVAVDDEDDDGGVDEGVVHERVGEESAHPPPSSPPPSSPLVMTVDGPCARCSMVNINGSTGSMDSRVLPVLSAYRKQGIAINFGQFLSMPDCAGRFIAALSAVDRMAWLRVGDCCCVSAD